MSKLTLFDKSSSSSSASSLIHIQLLFTFICLLQLVTAFPGLNIDNGPAPSPEDGPPLSRNATRDKRLLPYQITGLAGAYVIFTATALTLLLTLGKRLRRQALAGSSFYRVNMVKTHINGTSLGVETQDPSPISPIKAQQWESPVDSENGHMYPSPVSPTTGAPRSWVKPSGSSHQTHASQSGSVSTFDERVIDHDRARNQTEMERLYAAVAVHEQDKEKRQEATRSQISSQVPSIRSPRQDHFAGLPTSPKPHQQNAPQMYPLASPAQQNFSAAALSPQQAQFGSPLASPTSFNFVAYQPPMSPNALSHPMAPTPAPNPLSPPLSPRENGSSRLSKANPLSFFSSRNRGSSGEERTSRISFRGLPISNPLSSPKLKNSIGVHSDEVPLSPRMYNPYIPPSSPGFNPSNNQQHSVNEIAMMPPIPQSTEASSQPHPNPMSSNPTPTTKRGAPAPLTLGTSNLTSPSHPSSTRLPTTATTVTTATQPDLPLRSFASSPSTHLHNPLSPPQSAPHTRLQFADRRESRLNPYANGPKTGVPYPHSPYMPFSPVTPVSATIKTGKELKMAKKMARMEEKEMVAEEDEIWGN